MWMKTKDWPVWVLALKAEKRNPIAFFFEIMLLYSCVNKVVVLTDLISEPTLVQIDGGRHDRFFLLDWIT